MIRLKTVIFSNIYYLYYYAQCFDSYVHVAQPIEFLLDDLLCGYHHPSFPAGVFLSTQSKINSIYCYRLVNNSVIVSRPFYGGMYIKATISSCF